jgi:hypothetical protein
MDKNFFQKVLYFAPYSSDSSAGIVGRCIDETALGGLVKDTGDKGFLEKFLKVNLLCNLLHGNISHFEIIVHNRTRNLDARVAIHTAERSSSLTDTKSLHCFQNSFFYLYRISIGFGLRPRL